MAYTTRGAPLLKAKTRVIAPHKLSSKVLIYVKEELLGLSDYGTRQKARDRSDRVLSGERGMKDAAQDHNN